MSSPITLSQRGAERLNRFGLICVAIYLVVLPLGHVTAIRSISIVLGLVSATLYWLYSDSKRLPLVVAFVIWLAVACLSLLTTVDLLVSVDAITHEVVRSALIYFIFFTLTRSEEAFPVLSWATTASALILTLLAVHMSMTHDRWVPGYLPSLGDFATTAITLIPLLSVAIVKGRRLLRLAAILATAGLILGGYLTHSRGFWLTLICAGGTAFIIWIYYWKRLSWKSLLVLIAFTVIAVGMAAKVADLRGKSLGYFADRSSIYLAVGHKIVDNPLTGTGFGHETDRMWYRAITDIGGRVIHAHNIVLSYLDQMGLLGLVVLLVLFGMPLGYMLNRLRLPGALPYVSAGVSLLVAIFVKNSLDYFFTGANLWLYFAHLGIYVGLLQRIESAHGKHPGRMNTAQPAP